MNKKLLSYIKQSPTAYHACETTARRLREAGYERLYEGMEWRLAYGGKYYVTRNGSSLIAFSIPNSDARGFMIAAAHTDSPALKIKDNASISDASYTRLSAEVYGGPIYSTWLDRPLAIAGRVILRDGDGISARLVDTKAPVALIPNVAIHMNRKLNTECTYNAAVDLVPLYGDGAPEQGFGDLIASLANAKAEELLSTDLYAYNCQDGVEWGSFVSAPRLDDLQCAFAATEALLSARECAAIPVLALFDNEEVGSQTKQGAASTLLFDTLSRISESICNAPKSYASMLANTLLLSCDNAHAVHPNHPEYADKNHSVKMNDGVVIKYNANQKYTSDGISAALVKLLCERAGAPYQLYCNRADMAGGSTLGSIATTKVSVRAADIGLAQLAMHASFETAGNRDTEHLYRTLTEFYSHALKETANGITVE